MGRSARSSHVEGRRVETHGDLTFGCGMHRGELAHTCSCLVSEARATEDALKPAEWLWSPNQRLGCETVSSRDGRRLMSSHWDGNAIQEAFISPSRYVNHLYVRMQIEW